MTFVMFFDDVGLFNNLRALLDVGHCGSVPVGPAEGLGLVPGTAVRGSRLKEFCPGHPVLVALVGCLLQKGSRGLDEVADGVQCGDWDLEQMHN